MEEVKKEEGRRKLDEGREGGTEMEERGGIKGGKGMEEEERR